MGGRRHMAVVAVCAALLFIAHVAESALPHVDDCFLCQKCHTGDPPGRRLLARRGFRRKNTVRTVGRYTTNPNRTYVPFAGFKFQTAPRHEDFAGRKGKPNCTECYGCSTQLTPLGASPVKVFGKNVAPEVGASPEWLFLADLPDTPTTGRKAVVKVWCVPIDKVRGTFISGCQATADRAATAVQFLVAQQKVMEECGLMDVTIKVWPARVNAIVPGYGVHITWDGLWMERAPGLSLNMLSYGRTSPHMTEAVRGIFGDKLNGTRIVQAALFDGLSSQCDRHGQNVFMTDKGDITLIDNLQALTYDWQNCIMDSIFLPGTQKHAIIRWGGSIVWKAKGAKRKRSVNPMVVMDYRCFVEGGKIGTNYPPQVKQCLTKLAGMTPQTILKEYGFPHLESAAVLHSRAKAMITKGFEWALRYSEPRLQKAKAYRTQQPCCNLTIPLKGFTQCGHEWKDEIELPFGNPQSGGAWDRPYPDPGSYEGGTYLDEPAQA
ncbi:hypothetical protein HYH03_012697 [Edaphochlamys debaryana]|uniref:PI3K/PI4K catalytic domain-containing protein n=1 Tax=Edaphochlamys debaryana TaxID=47281 RepID=A0A836BTM3_9CHLO|nr:hypothetical protein HYH03_012697 [Edaphochlamys debaryana]|eukprot:KAG2488696.1 hypothetical protein HYH03_012697 [Edaphochlamys debaryana]